MRAAAQRLTADTARGRRPAMILRQVVGLQAQVLSAAALGMRVRSTSLRIGDVKRALSGDRSIVRSWLMRGTLHLVASDDIRWLVQLLGPVFVRANATRYAQLGLDDDLRSSGVAAIRKILTGSGAMTRNEMVSRLRRRGIALDSKTQAPIHLIGLAALQGVLCLGPERYGGGGTDVALDDLVPQGPGPLRASHLIGGAPPEVAAHGTATIGALSRHSGLPPAAARA